MSCIYKQDDDKCEMFCSEIHAGDNYTNSPYGFSVEDIGFCAVYDDPEPDVNCSMYEPVDSEND